MPIQSLHVPLGSRIPWFEVTDLDGRVHTTADLPVGRPVVVAFLCNHSPYVLHLEKDLAAAARRWAESGVCCIGVASNDERAYPADNREELARQAARAGWTFPYGFDESQRAAKAFGASCTPEFFLYDRDGRLAYHGQYDGSRPATTTTDQSVGRDLCDAIEAVLADRPVARQQHPAFGCSIKWRAGNEPSYMFTS